MSRLVGVPYEIIRPQLLIGSEAFLIQPECDDCRYYGKQRYESNRARQTRNAIISRGGTTRTVTIDAAADIEIDQEACAAEVAFCKLLNIYPFELFKIEPRSSRAGQDAGDAYLYQARFSIDIKHTSYESGQLLAVPWKDEQAVDCYVLMIGTMPRFRFAGAMLASELFKEHRLTDLGKGPTYAALQAELTELHKLPLGGRHYRGEAWS